MYEPPLHLPNTQFNPKIDFHLIFEQWMRPFLFRFSLDAVTKNSFKTTIPFFILNENSNKLNENSNKLNENSNKLNENSNILNENSNILNENSNKLNENSNKLNENSKKLKENFFK